MSDSTQAHRFETAPGMVAALDQSGGSTPKALALYGIEPSEYSGDAAMFDLIHAARTRVITSPAFTADRVIAAILFEGTLDRTIEGVGSAEYLWGTKGIVPFLKIDKGLAEEQDGVQVLRDIPGLGSTLERAAAAGVYGTKERSVIHAGNPDGIARVLDQQFALATTVLEAGLTPIIEPEVDIHAPDKQEAEEILRAGILERLTAPLPGKVALKLSIPSVDGYYGDLVGHAGVARVVALSGGYSRDEADARLARNPGVIASFSRALLEGLTAQQTQDEFDRTLDASIAAIVAASNA